MRPVRAPARSARRAGYGLAPHGPCDIVVQQDEQVGEVTCGRSERGGGDACQQQCQRKDVVVGPVFEGIPSPCFGADTVSRRAVSCAQSQAGGTSSTPSDGGLGPLRVLGETSGFVGPAERDGVRVP
ncbi:hypothetical protein KNE206_73570 [Kitasatospora sp. NE20-6]